MAVRKKELQIASFANSENEAYLAHIKAKENQDILFKHRVKYAISVFLVACVLYAFATFAVNL